jgi:hypothetical protein
MANPTLVPTSTSLNSNPFKSSYNNFDIEAHFAKKERLLAIKKERKRIKKLKRRQAKEVKKKKGRERDVT